MEYCILKIIPSLIPKCLISRDLSSHSMVGVPAIFLIFPDMPCVLLMVAWRSHLQSPPKSSSALGAERCLWALAFASAKLLIFWGRVKTVHPMVQSFNIFHPFGVHRNVSNTNIGITLGSLRGVLLMADLWLWLHMAPKCSKLLEISQGESGRAHQITGRRWGETWWNQTSSPNRRSGCPHMCFSSDICWKSIGGAWFWILGDDEILKYSRCRGFCG